MCANEEATDASEEQNGHERMSFDGAREIVEPRRAWGRASMQTKKLAAANSSLDGTPATSGPATTMLDNYAGSLAHGSTRTRLPQKPVA